MFTRICVFVCLKKNTHTQIQWSDNENMLDLPVLLFDAFPMHARLSGTVVGPRQTQETVSAGWAQAVEAVDLINTGSSALTRV